MASSPLQPSAWALGRYIALAGLLVTLSPPCTIPASAAPFWGKKLTPAEEAREERKELRESLRPIRKERRSMKISEQKMIRECKKEAKSGNMQGARAIAKNIAFARKSLAQMDSNILNIEMKISSVRAQRAMLRGVEGMTKVMKSVNKQMDGANAMENMRKFAQESEKMEIQGEMMDDMLEDALGGSDEEAEADGVVDEILAELGIELQEKLDKVTVPSKLPPVEDKQPVKQEAADVEDDELTQRLEALRS